MSKYEVNDAQVQKSYQVEDDRAINQAGFTNQTDEEVRLKNELNKYSEKNQIACILLCVIHCHYFYVGRIGRGLLCLFTANFLYIGFVIDFFLIACGKFKDKTGRYVNSGNRMAAEIGLNDYYRAQGIVR